MLVGEPSAEKGVADLSASTLSGQDHNSPRESVQDAVFIEIRGNTSIVTDRWKMGLYPHDDEGDLYDLADDPFELINRYGDPAVRDVRESLTRRIIEFSPVWPPAFSVTGGR